MYSMMTVLNEHVKTEKYSYLVYIEFQEMICRAAIIGFEDQDTVEFKVFWLL